MPELPVITLDQLQQGLYISFDLHWSKHPFLSNEFKITSEKELGQLRQLPIEILRYDPEQSDVEPLPAANTAGGQQPVRARQSSEIRARAIKERRGSLKKCEKAFTETASKIRNVIATLRSNPKGAVNAAGDVVSGMVDDLISDEATLQLVNMKDANQTVYFHSINVTTLSLMLGKRMGLPESDMRLLGIGAMLHDTGFCEIPDRILRKKGPLTKAELELYKRHTLYGQQIASKIGILPKEVEEIISCHHEMMDGSGYPRGIKAGNLSVLTRIVTLIDAYDNLCNPRSGNQSLTPHEAVSTLYAKEKGRYDPGILSKYITYMGIYPPGTIVRLSNGNLALVISINQKALLQPNVMLYDPSVPAIEALILDLREEYLEVKEALRRSELPTEVADYLNLGEGINYFFSRSRANGT